MKLWPHQEYGIEAAFAGMNRGATGMCLCAATGLGKSVMIRDISHRMVNDAKNVLLLCERRLLLSQLETNMKRSGLPVRVIASGVKDVGRQRFSIASLQTLLARDLKPPAHLVMVDEAHKQKGPKATELLQSYQKDGVPVIGFTATPLDLSHIYPDLVLCGDRSDGFRCGALVKAEMYSCGEMDTKDIKRVATGEYVMNDVVKKVWSQKLVGHIVEHAKRLNPELRPIIVFAPNVDSSIWLCDEFNKAGINTASIDGKDVYYQGQRETTTQNRRDEILEKFRSGEIKAICNCDVLTEGIDIPEAYHLILARPFGSICNYVQAVGRILRNHPSLPERNGHRRVLIQDHGGCWWRMPSPNVDLESIWKRFYKSSVKAVTDYRRDCLRAKDTDPDDPLKKELGLECPVCHAIQNPTSSGRCYSCNTDLRGKRKRSIVQTNGELVRVDGVPHDIRPKRQISDRELLEEAWKSAYFSAKRSGRTFKQARAWLTSGKMRKYPQFAGVQLPMDLPCMPKDPADWERRCSAVDTRELL